MIEVDQTFAKDLLSAFDSSVANSQKQIFNQWLERISNNYQTILPENSFTAETLHEFLFDKTLTYFFPYFYLIKSPFQTPSMQEAIEIIRTAFIKKESQCIAIFGDRDVDGISSSTIFYLFLKDVMKFQNVHVFLPKEEDKYGLTEEVAQRMLEVKPDVLVTLDCGSSNKETFSMIKEASNKTIATIVIDHHFIPEDKKEYPDVGAFVNPKRLSPLFVERDLCTAGLTLKFIWALTYSYTSEYDKVYQLDTKDKKIFLQNLISTKDYNTIDRSFSFVKDDANDSQDFTKIWQELCKKNKSIFQFNQYLDNFSVSDFSLLKFNAWQNLHFSTIYAKIKPYIPLAALGTVADLMPLVDDNRILVSRGISILKQEPKIAPVGLQELLKKLNLSSATISEQDFAFTVCPTINAAGRLGKAEKSFEALTSNDALDAAKKAFTLKEINSERKELSKKATALLEESLDKNHSDFPIVIAYHKDIHRGISGIVASKLAGNHKKPAIVLVDDGECLRGSARSFANENVYRLVSSCSELLLQFGGHRQASGFSLAYDKKDQFIAQAYKHSSQLFDSEEKPDINKSFGTAIKYSANEIIVSDFSQWLQFAPYGMLNPHPVVSIKTEEQIKIVLMGADKNHARLNFMDIKDSLIEGVWFFHQGEALSIQNKDATKMNFFAEPQISSFQGKTRYQLKITRVEDS